MDLSISPYQIIFFVVATFILILVITAILAVVIPRTINQDQKTKQNELLKKNWKWFIPATCVFFIGITLLQNFRVCQSEIYKESLIYLKNKKITNYLGTPITSDFFVRGEVSGLGPVKYNIHYGISGPNGKGEVAAIGFEKNGILTIEKLYVLLRGGTKVTLLDINQ